MPHQIQRLWYPSATNTSSHGVRSPPPIQYSANLFYLVLCTRSPCFYGVFIMPSPWSASTERKLLLCIIDPKATPRWNIIAQGMGPHFSAEACRYVPPCYIFLISAYNCNCFPPFCPPFLSIHSTPSLTCKTLALVRPNLRSSLFATFQSCHTNGRLSGNVACFCLLSPLPISGLQQIRGLLSPPF